MERSAPRRFVQCLAVLSIPDENAALFPDIITDARTSAVREGHLTLLRFLPISLGDLFEPHPPTLRPCSVSWTTKSLFETADPPRRVFIEGLSHSGSLDLILPAIESGIHPTTGEFVNPPIELLGPCCSESSPER